MITSKEMYEVDKKAENIGIDVSILMENAGANVAKIVDEKVNLKNRKVLIFCGTGNNAGDGLVFARHALIYGAEVYIYFIKDLKYLRTTTTKNNYKILKNLKLMKKKIKFYVEKIPGINADVLVDALLGVGLKGEIKGEYKKAILKFNSLKGFKVSIDCPSGINADTGKAMGVAIKPDLTITFYDKKEGLNKRNSGEIAVSNIGIPKI